MARVITVRDHVNGFHRTKPRAHENESDERVGSSQSLIMIDTRLKHVNFEKHSALSACRQTSHV